MTKTHKIEINFPVGIDFPDGWEQTLDALVGMICEQYQKENPDRVMWPSGHGSKPIWNEPNEPDFDDSVYCIDVCEREDFGGSNRYNPNRDKLRKEASDARKARREKTA